MKFLLHTRIRTTGRIPVFLQYIAVFVCALMITALAKRAPCGRLFLRTPALRRHFSFSSWFSSQPSSSSSSSASSSAAAAAAVGIAAASNVAIPSIFNYDIAVAFQPKDREETNLFKKKSQKPSPAKESPSGEDNLFVSEAKQGFVALGVADGVGGWSEAGYDSSAISRELCAAAKARFEAEANVHVVLPKQILNDAFQEVMGSPKVEIGGTTACFGVLSPEYELKVANLGDSWCGVFRDNKLVHETNFQTHNFNTPYQLAKIPPHVMKQAELQGRRYIIDTPDMADEYQWSVQKNDLVIFATDGVTDNIVPQDIETFLLDNESLDTAALSTKFVKNVVKLSKDTNYASAFAQELSRLTGQNYLGGKEDDITVVFARIK